MIIDFTTPEGKVRLLIPDDKDAPLFSDVKIAAFLEMEAGVVKRAAALALETIATKTAMTLKYIETNALKVDGSKPAQVCLNRAKMLREQSAPEPEIENEDEWEVLGGAHDDGFGGLGRLYDDGYGFRGF